MLPSAQLQHPAGEEKGREARREGWGEGEEGEVGGEGAGASRQRACALRAGAAPRPARPEVQLLSWAGDGLSHAAPRPSRAARPTRARLGSAPTARRGSVAAPGSGAGGPRLRGHPGDLGTSLAETVSRAQAHSTSRSPAARVILPRALGDCLKPESCL